MHTPPPAYPGTEWLWLTVAALAAAVLTVTAIHTHRNRKPPTRPAPTETQQTIERRYTRPKRGITYRYPPGTGPDDYPPQTEHCTIHINRRTYTAQIGGGTVTAEVLDQHMDMAGGWKRDSADEHDAMINRASAWVNSEIQNRQRS